MVVPGGNRPGRYPWMGRRSAPPTPGTPCRTLPEPRDHPGRPGRLAAPRSTLAPAPRQTAAPSGRQGEGERKPAWQSRPPRPGDSPLAEPAAEERELPSPKPGPCRLRAWIRREHRTRPGHPRRSAPRPSARRVLCPPVAWWESAAGGGSARERTGWQRSSISVHPRAPHPWVGSRLSERSASRGHGPRRVPAPQASIRRASRTLHHSRAGPWSGGEPPSRTGAWR